jgi:inorganic phosphate transporter, PiT family
LMALSFEFVNGFHDTANAVATVIYTHSLRPVVAVVWSGFCNLMGVLTSSGAVAFGIVALLPVELVLNVGSGAGFAMVFALLISAIIWNVGTWYLGLPASSSHTLVGSIMGVGLANSMITPGHVFGEGVNWAKAQEVFTSLLVSPIVGFVCSALLLLLAKFLIRRPELYAPAEAGKSPPWWIRLLLIFTCTGVSFSHGSNDGQKGMGLIMLILIGILPAVYALDLGTSSQALKNLETAIQPVTEIVNKYAKDRPATADEAKDELSAFLKTTGHLSDKTFGAIAVEIQNLQVAMATIQVADIYGLPVSTTHVLSSGIAGTMAANRSGLQMATLRNILLAWVLTIPVCVLLGAGTFSATLFVVFNVFGRR